MNKNLTIIFLMLSDLIITIIVSLLSVYLRFDGDVPDFYLNNTILYLPLLVIIKMITFYFFRMYSILWRYASTREFSIIVIANIVSSVIFFFSLLFVGERNALPRSVYIISMLLNVFFTVGIRSAVRFFSYYGRKNVLLPKAYKKNILVIGAGDAGAIVAREILQNKKNALTIIGFIDDDKNKLGLSIHGVKILGARDKIIDIAEKFEAEEIVIAMPSAKKEEIRNIINICQETACKIKITPSVYELTDGKFTLAQIRDVAVEDLLGREPVKLDQNKVKTYIVNKRILITGAGGSIGSELCRQVAKIKPKSVVLLGKGENSIYDIHYEMTKRNPEIEFFPVIADIRDKERIENIFRQFKPEIVFHAAAHKHVPLMELQPEEAVRNNILGTETVARMASKYKAERLIMISTDKAVNPTSVMGATKRVAEMMLSAISKDSETIFSTVRFGNVLGSRGSVIPLFKKQIEEGGPVTVTHPEMKRYFMTIPEASQLVLQAGALAKGGEVFVLDMGEPVKIVDLAKELISLSGYIPDKDIKIEFTGSRAGEKLFEELLTAEEGTTATIHEKIFVANRSSEFNVQQVERIIEQMMETADSEKIVKALSEILPVYKPNRADCQNKNM